MKVSVYFCEKVFPPDNLTTLVFTHLTNFMCYCRLFDKAVNSCKFTFLLESYLAIITPQIYPQHTAVLECVMCIASLFFLQCLWTNNILLPKGACFKGAN